MFSDIKISLFEERIIVIRPEKSVGALFVFGTVFFCDAILAVLHQLQNLRIHPFAVMLIILVIIEIAYKLGVSAEKIQSDIVAFQKFLCNKAFGAYRPVELTVIYLHSPISYAVGRIEK